MQNREAGTVAWYQTTQRAVNYTLDGPWVPVPLEEAGEDLVLELAGTHGLWRDLAKCIREPGVCAIATCEALSAHQYCFQSCHYTPLTALL